MNQIRSKRSQVGLTFLLVLVIGLLAVNLILTMQLSGWLDSTLTRLETKRSLPCAAIPTRFVVDAPECANLLLQSMNVTNVRVVARGAGPELPDRNESLVKILP